jgi:hypothetical protein
VIGSKLPASSRVGVALDTATASTAEIGGTCQESQTCHSSA